MLLKKWGMVFSEYEERIDRMMYVKKRMRNLVAGISILAVGLILSSCQEPEVTSGNVIPAKCEYMIASTGKVLKEGELFPTECMSGDIFSDFEKGYEYSYAVEVQIDSNLTEAGREYTYDYIKNENVAGWSAMALNRDREHYGELRNKINEAPVKSLDYCFYGCEKMVEAPQIPTEVVSMDGAFGKCYALKEMPLLPEGIISMENTFEQCISLMEISNLPTMVKDMEFTFAECKALEKVCDIPNGVENMQGTFNRCEALRTVGVIPESVMNLSYVFTGCKNLEGDLFIRANPTAYDGCFRGTEKRIFLYGSDETNNWNTLFEMSKTVESGGVANVVIPG